LRLTMLQSCPVLIHWKLMSISRLDLGSSGILATPLGFGCATLFRASDPAQRSRLLHAAYDAGIRHFDVAPMYGLGRAEPELGSFTRRHRSEVTIATKFGIRPTLAARGLAYAQRPVRRAMESSPVIRDQARAHAGAPSRLLYEKSGYDADGARRSLHRSLRSLKTDYVDLLLLHDPLPGSVRSDEVSSFLEDARAVGLIRSWGVAGALETTSDAAQFFPRVPVLQLQDDVFVQSVRRAPIGSAFITFGVISRVLGRIVQHVRADESTRFRWEGLIGADCGDPDTTSSFLLRAALQANSSGVVLFGTTQVSHIRTAAVALEKHISPASDKSDMDSFISLVNAELCEPTPAGGRGI
jgi:D-threo-aldose 1-dehydrogenase